MESMKSMKSMEPMPPIPGDRLIPTSVREGVTYFGAPPGVTVVAAAGGRVTGVDAEHVRIDHGEGLATTTRRIARALVPAGAEVARGEPVALTGEAPLAFSVTLDGAAVDPFAREGEVALWLTGNMPQPNDELFDDSLDIELDEAPSGPHSRVPRLDLPFSAADYDGVAFVDGV